jgi:hypothetical protein
MRFLNVGDSISTQQTQNSIKKITGLEIDVVRSGTLIQEFNLQSFNSNQTSDYSESREPPKEQQTTSTQSQVSQDQSQSQSQSQSISNDKKRPREKPSSESEPKRQRNISD